MIMPFKVAFIGAGSIEFTRGLVRDLLSVSAFKDIELVFMDMSSENLDMVTRLVQRDIDANGLSIKIFATKDRREALKVRAVCIQRCAYRRPSRPLRWMLTFR